MSGKQNRCSTRPLFPHPHTTLTMYSWLIQMLKQNILDTVADRTNAGGRRDARLLVDDDGVLAAGFCDDAPASDGAALSRRDPPVGGFGGRGGEDGSGHAVMGGSAPASSRGGAGAAPAGGGIALCDGVRGRQHTWLAGGREGAPTAAEKSPHRELRVTDFDRRCLFFIRFSLPPFSLQHQQRHYTFSHTTHTTHHTPHHTTLQVLDPLHPCLRPHLPRQQAPHQPPRQLPPQRARVGRARRHGVRVLRGSPRQVGQHVTQRTEKGRICRWRRRGMQGRGPGRRSFRVTTQRKHEARRDCAAARSRQQRRRHCGWPA